MTDFWIAGIVSDYTIVDPVRVVVVLADLLPVWVIWVSQIGNAMGVGWIMREQFNRSGRIFAMLSSFMYAFVIRYFGGYSATESIVVPVMLAVLILVWELRQSLTEDLDEATAKEDLREAGGR